MKFTNKFNLPQTNCLTFINVIAHNGLLRKDCYEWKAFGDKQKDSKRI